jgi:Holliday junction resolvasome RuvABC endonuclease subunit
MTRIAGYLGFDSSLNGSGIGFISRDGEYLASSTIRVGEARGFKRLGIIRAAVRDFLVNRDVLAWAIEGYSVNSTDRPFDLGSAYGVGGLAAYDSVGAEPLIVPPSSLKLFAAGSGHAPKEDLLSSVKNELGVDLGDADDEADALCLARFAFVVATKRATKRHEADAIVKLVNKQPRPRARRNKTPSL